MMSAIASYVETPRSAVIYRADPKQMITTPTTRHMILTGIEGSGMSFVSISYVN